MALWFSATAAVPSLIAGGIIDADDASMLTSMVQLGFVAGTAVSALLLLADRFDPRRIFMTASLVAAAANLSILVTGADSWAALAARFVTGACMAGVYPIGMKIATSWAKGDMGLVIGLLVGALSIGSALPHLLGALGGLEWRFVIGGASLIAAAAGLLILLVPVGPNVRPSPPFDPTRMFEALRRPALRLANFGYLGHMWELYAVWSWAGLFIAASFAAWSGSSSQTWLAPLATFLMIAIGGLGAMLAGHWADRIGRTTVTIAALLTSGICCLVAGFTFGMHPAIVTSLCLVWGISVIADSAQFSASIAELSDSDIVGTMLTLQTCMGFLLTLITIELVGGLVDTIGWQWIFVLLAPGPFFGAWAMWTLRHRPEAARLAGGRG